MDVVGAAANIVQLIDFTTRVVIRMKEYNDARKDVPEVFLDIMARLPLFLIEVESLKDWLDSGAASGLTPAHIAALHAFITRCCDVVIRIHKLQASVFVKPSDSKSRRIGKALLSIIKDNDVAKEWERLQSHHTALLNCYKSLLTSAASPLPPDSAFASVIYEVRAKRTTFFVSRPNILFRIEQEFSKRAPPSVSKVAVLLGSGGQGKTQMALQVHKVNPLPRLLSRPGF